MTADWLALARLHAPLLVVATPCLGAVLALFSPHARVACAAGVASAALGCLLATDLALRALVFGVEVQEVAEGIALNPDGVGVFSVALIAMCTLLAMLAGAASLGGGLPQAAPFPIIVLLLMCAGWSGALLASDLVSAFIAVEIASLAGVGILALSADRERTRLNGAFKALLANGAGSALLLSGVFLAARSLDGIEFAGVALAHVSSPPLSATGFGLIFVGLVMKAGAAPFHAWVGAALGKANALAALSVGVVGVVGALTLIARIAIYAFSVPAAGDGASFVFAALGCVGILFGSLQAVGAQNLRRLAAYATVAQAGGVLLCVALGSSAGFAAALIQLAALAAAAAALFAGAAAADVYRLDALDGIARRTPLAAAAITFGAVSLIGAPLTIGFLGRWRLVEAAVGAGWWWAVGAMTLASLGGVIYGGRLIERMYFRRANAAATHNSDPWRFALMPALIAAIVGVSLGLAPGALLRACDVAIALTGAAS